jgi:hypothetical protein
VHGWISGKIRRCERTAIDAVLATYASLPDA